MLRLAISNLILLCLTAHRALAFDPIYDFCRRFGHQSAVVDQHLYVTGGYVDYGGGVSPSTQNYTNTYLLWADLTTVNNVQFPPMYSNLSKPGFVPSTIGGAFWPDTVNKKIYLWGGEYNWTSSPPASQRLWYYDVLFDEWNQTGNVVNGVQSASFGASAVDQVKGVAYYYGGWSSNATILGFNGNPVAQSGLVTYDMTLDIWNNVSFIDNVPRAEGLLSYVPISDSGVLVYFGGIQQTGNNSFTGSPMDVIHIFDIASQKFYSQVTSGPTPPMRRRFCGGASWAEDRSSYNIYFYGGDVPPDQQGLGFNDVWILSLPSFTWIYYYNGTGFEHHSMSCNVVNEGQMIIMGGYFPNSSNIACDSPLTFGAHNLDLGSVNVIGAQWYQYFPNVTTYNVPPNLTAVIGGSASGGATVTKPAGGFNDNDLNVYMTRQAPLSGRTATRDVSAATAYSNSSSSSSNHVGAIVGGVVGGVGGFVLLLLFACLCLRRRRKAKTAADARRGSGASTVMAEAPGSMPIMMKHDGRSLMTTPSTTHNGHAQYPLATPPNRSQQRFHEHLPAQYHPQHQPPPPQQYYPPPPAPQLHEEPPPTFEMSALSPSPHPRSPWRSLDSRGVIREE